PEADLYKPRKRKQKASEGVEEPVKKVIKKEAVTTSASVKEKVVKENVVKEKGVQKAEAVIAEKAKRMDKKRKAP
ncbi:hypothetical protein A2U01_0096151, partial [Trifolium medium]|nr:hypothetical protein [Trifolium medium]